MPSNIISINDSKALSWIVGDSKMDELVEWLNRNGWKWELDKVEICPFCRSERIGLNIDKKRFECEDCKRHFSIDLHADREYTDEPVQCADADTPSREYVNSTIESTVQAVEEQTEEQAQESRPAVRNPLRSYVASKRFRDPIGALVEQNRAVDAMEEAYASGEPQEETPGIQHVRERVDAYILNKLGEGMSPEDVLELVSQQPEIISALEKDMNYLTECSKQTYLPLHLPLKNFLLLFGEYLEREKRQGFPGQAISDKKQELLGQAIFRVCQCSQRQIRFDLRQNTVTCDSCGTTQKISDIMTPDELEIMGIQ